MTFTDEQRREIEEIAAQSAEAVAVRAARETVRAAPTSGLLTQPAWGNATVSGDTLPGADVSLLVDGTADVLPSAAQNATGHTLRDGMRVLVLYRPNGGALVKGMLDAVDDDPVLGWHVLDTIPALSGTGTMIFSSISQDYDALRITGYIRVASANVNVVLSMRLNGDASAIYDSDEVGGNNAIAFAAQYVGGTRGVIACAPGSTATANNFASVQVLIPNYRGASRRTWDSSGGWCQSASMFTRKASGIWRSTAAVSQIDIQDSTGNSGNMAAGSWAVLEGLLLTVP